MRKFLNRRCSTARRILSSFIVLCMVIVLCPLQNRALAVPPYDFTANEVTSSITVDGFPNESAWHIDNALTVLAGDNQISFGSLWDSSNLYLYFNVTDPAVINSNAAYPWNDDSIEIYIDGDLTKGAYNSHGVQFIFRYGDENTYIYSNSSCQATGVEHKSVKTDNGYAMEVAIPWANIGGLTVNPTKVIGMNFHCNDKDENIQSAEVSNVSYFAPSPGPDYENSSGWGEMTLGEPSEATLQSISITKPANKLVYKVGDTLDITGMEVTGTYSDSTTKIETVSPTDVYNFDSAKASANENLSVVVNGKTTYYSVCVNPASTVADQKINFRLSGNVADKTIVTDGWKLNTDITDPNVALAAVFDGNTNAVYAKTTSDPIDASRVIAFDFQVNADGIYTPVFTGGGSPTGGIGNIYIDDAYIGTYDFYNASAYVPQIPSANLKTIALQSGVHTLVFEAVGRNAARTDTETKWRMYIGELNLVSKAAFPTLSSVALSANSTTIEANQTTNLNYAATMSDGFIDNLLPPFRSGIDTSYSKAYSYSTNDIVSVDANNIIKGLKAGTTNVTSAVTMGGITKSGALAMTVTGATPPTLTDIAITKPAAKLSYKVGETLDIAGLEVTGTYSDGSAQKETITTSNVTGFNSSAATASQTLTVTVNGKAASYTISVVNNDQVAPTGLTGVAPTTSANTDGKINGTTTAMEYKLSTAATYTPAAVTSITGLIPGIYNVRFAAKPGYNVSADTSITVPSYSAVTLSSIAITTQPTKKTYKVGEALDITGMVVTGTYSDSSKKVETVTNTNVTGFSSTAAAASQTLTVTVGGKTTTYTVAIINNDQAAPTGLVGVKPTSASNNDGKITSTTTDMEYKLSTASTYTAVTGTSITGLVPGTYNVRYAAKAGYNASPTTNVTISAYITATLSSIAITTQPTKKTYKVGEALDITGLVVTGTYSDGSNKTETIANSNITGFNSAAAVASQLLTVTVSGKTATFTVAIVNNDQAAPTGLVGTAPTSSTSKDGIITGTTTFMEYKLSTASTYTTVSGTQIIGLAAGTYNVRYKAKTGYNAGAAANVTVPAYVAATLNSIAITTQPTKKTYKVDEYLSLSGMVVTGTYSDGIQRTVSLSTSNVTGFNSSAITASQTLTVTVSGKTATFTVSIIAGDQAAPKGISGIAPTSTSNNDGKITGLTTAMEYKKSGATAYTAVTSTEITGLAAGTYYVRYKAKTNYNAGADATVAVAEYTPITLSSIVITKQPAKLIYHVGDELDLTGLTVTGTYSDGSNKTETVTSDNVTGFDNSARAIDQNLTVNIGGKSATFNITIYDASFYKATIQSSTGGQILKGTTGNYQEGDVIELVTSPASGFKFLGWSVNGGGTFKNRNVLSTTFTMPAADVSITASFTRSYLGGIGGGGSSSGGTYGHPSSTSTTTTATTPSNSTPTTSNDKFSDLAGFDWAKDAINSLAQDGIINGMSDTTYAPGAKITRADFVTLLVRALNLTAEVTDNFSDVNSNDYYYSTLGVAKKLGIITGTGGNNYNPKASIARQDMMVITARALKAAGFELTDAAKTELSGFSDAAAVADYASSDVATLIKNGIIAGSGNAINPKGGSTRAEVAVMLNRILSMK